MFQKNELFKVTRGGTVPSVMTACGSCTATFCGIKQLEWALWSIIFEGITTGLLHTVKLEIGFPFLGVQELLLSHLQE